MKTAIIAGLLTLLALMLSAALPSPSIGATLRVTPGRCSGTLSWPGHSMSIPCSDVVSTSLDKSGAHVQLIFTDRAAQTSVGIAGSLEDDALLHVQRIYLDSADPIPATGSCTLLALGRIHCSAIAGTDRLTLTFTPRSESH